MSSVLSIVYFLTVLDVSLSSPVYPRHCVLPPFEFSIGHPTVSNESCAGTDSIDRGAR